MVNLTGAYRPTQNSLGTICLLALTAIPCFAQGNYEVQVYGSEMVPPGRTMVELHSNFTFEGSKTPVDGVLPDNHALHETIEITQGITDWFETGFLHLYELSFGRGLSVGGRPHPAARASPRGVALAGERELVD